MTARIRVVPSDIEFDAAVGETLMAAAWRKGLYWPTTCGGQGICTTCLTQVVSGGECLGAMSRSERKTLVAERGESILNRPARLACQAAVAAEGTIVVEKPGVRPPGE
jgi:2Fe-2S ferredoxin